MKNSTAPRGLSALFQPIDLTEGACWKTILRFSFPIILSYLLQQVYSISDAAIVGQTLSAEEVAGVNDIAPIVNIFLQFAFGVSAGFCVITSCNVGSHNQPGVRRSLATQIVLSSVLTVLLTGLALLLLNPMLAWINVAKDSGSVYTAAFTYCAIIFAGIGAQLFYNFICSFLRAMGDSVTPLVFLLFSTILNVGLDLLFILSFHWGVAGAAIATVLAQLIAVVMHCKTSPDRFESAKALLNYGFANYAIVDPMENVTLEQVPVVLGKQDFVEVEASGAGTVLLDKALAGSVTCTAELDESVQAPVQKGQRLGTLRVEAGGKVLREIELVAAEAVPALGFFDIWKQMLGTVCMAG